MATDRRDFLGLALAGSAAVGAGASVYGLKRSWDALPSVISAGFTTVDLSQTKAGKLYTTVWRGKPIFILRKKEDMISCDQTEIVIGKDRYSVMVGLCTHLGCIPSYSESKQKFKCACHGGEFDSCGKQVFGPPPRPLDLPPFSLEGTKMVFGEEGALYKKMMKA